MIYIFHVVSDAPKYPILGATERAWGGNFGGAARQPMQGASKDLS